MIMQLVALLVVLVVLPCSCSPTPSQEADKIVRGEMIMDHMAHFYDAVAFLDVVVDGQVRSKYFSVT